MWPRHARRRECGRERRGATRKKARAYVPLLRGEKRNEQQRGRGVWVWPSWWRGQQASKQARAAATTTTRRRQRQGNGQGHHHGAHTTHKTRRLNTTASSPGSGGQNDAGGGTFFQHHHCFAAAPPPSSSPHDKQVIPLLYIYVPMGVHALGLWNRQKQGGNISLLRRPWTPVAFLLLLLLLQLLSSSASSSSTCPSSCFCGNIHTCSSCNTAIFLLWRSSSSSSSSPSWPPPPPPPPSSYSSSHHGFLLLYHPPFPPPFSLTPPSSPPPLDRPSSWSWSLSFIISSYALCPILPPSLLPSLPSPLAFIYRHRVVLSKKKEEET